MLKSVGFPGGSVGEESSCQHRRCKEHGFNPWVRKIPWRRKWQPTPVFLAGISHGQRSLAGYSPWGHEELDTTELTTNLENCWSETIQYWSQTSIFYSEKPKFYLPTNLRRWHSKLLLLSSMRFVGPSFNCYPCYHHHHSIWTHIGHSPWEEFCYIQKLSILLHFQWHFNVPLALVSWLFWPFVVPYDKGLTLLGYSEIPGSGGGWWGG